MDGESVGEAVGQLPPLNAYASTFGSGIRNPPSSAQSQPSELKVRYLLSGLMVKHIFMQSTALSCSGSRIGELLCLGYHMTSSIHDFGAFGGFKGCTPTAITLVFTVLLHKAPDLQSTRPFGGWPPTWPTRVRVRPVKRMIPRVPGFMRL